MGFLLSCSALYWVTTVMDLLKKTNKQTSGCNARKHWQWPETRMFGKGRGVSSWPCLQHKLPMNTNNQIGRKTWGCYLKNDCYEFISSSGVKSFWSNTMIHFWLYTDINIYGQAVHWKLTRQTTCLVSLKCHQLFNVLCSLSDLRSAPHSKANLTLG